MFLWCSSVRVLDSNVGFGAAPLDFVSPVAAKPDARSPAPCAAGMESPYMYSSTRREVRVLCPGCSRPALHPTERFNTPMHRVINDFNRRNPHLDLNAVDASLSRAHEPDEREALLSRAIPRAVLQLLPRLQLKQYRDLLSDPQFLQIPVHLCVECVREIVEEGGEETAVDDTLPSPQGSRVCYACPPTEKKQPTLTIEDLQSSMWRAEQSPGQPLASTVQYLDEGEELGATQLITEAPIGPGTGSIFDPPDAPRWLPPSSLAGFHSRKPPPYPPRPKTAPPPVEIPGVRLCSRPSKTQLSGVGSPDQLRKNREERIQMLRRAKAAKKASHRAYTAGYAAL